MREALLFAMTGGRDYKDKKTVFAKLNKFHAKYGFTHLMHGDAGGADAIADAWCDTKKGVQAVACRAHWDRDKRGAGPIRNSAMAILMPKCLIAFPGGTGTENMKAACRKLGIKVITVKERT